MSIALAALMGLCATACAPREGSVGVLYRVTGGRNAL